MPRRLPGSPVHDVDLLTGAHVHETRSTVPGSGSGSMWRIEWSGPAVGHAVAFRTLQPGGGQLHLLARLHTGPELGLAVEQGPRTFGSEEVRRGPHLAPEHGPPDLLTVLHRQLTILLQDQQMPVSHVAHLVVRSVWRLLQETLDHLQILDALLDLAEHPRVCLAIH